MTEQTFSDASPVALAGLDVVLVGTRFPENVGMAARAAPAWAVRSDAGRSRALGSLFNQKHSVTSQVKIKNIL